MLKSNRDRSPCFGKKSILSLLWLLGFYTTILPIHGSATSTEPLRYLIDFSTQPDGNAKEWLDSNGFEFQLDADLLNPRFSDGRLVLETKGQRAGIFAKHLQLPNVKYVRITWGVEQYPQGADWDKGIYRLPIGVTVTFGKEKIESGSLLVPDAPYFIGLFLGEKEQRGRAYTGSYYKRGGRYFCVPCGVPPSGKTVVTEFDLEQAFKTEFNGSRLPEISGIGFQMNTKDTKGAARAFLKKIEFLGP